MCNRKGEMMMQSFVQSAGSRPAAILAACAAIALAWQPLLASSGQAAPYSVVRTIAVGSEPRGCALSPNGTKLFVANYTSATVSAINTRTLQIDATVNVGGNPTAIAVTNNGNKKDSDENVFVTQFYSE